VTLLARDVELKTPPATPIDTKRTAMETRTPWLLQEEVLRD
jgi:hypothetical protein